MGKNGIFASMKILTKFMDLNFSVDMTDVLLDTLRLFPKETQDELTEQLLVKLDKEDLTEQEALQIIEEFEAAL